MRTSQNSNIYQNDLQVVQASTHRIESVGDDAEEL